MAARHAPFYRTRKALSRLPLATLLFASFISGALTLAFILSLLQPRPSLTHAEAALHHSKPSPLVVVAAGLPRTGSTWVYNVLRILLRMRDPNSVAGWYADLINIWRNHKTGRYDHMSQSWLSAYRSLNTSLLIKMHGPGPFKHFSKGKSLQHAADLTVITHRDLRTEVRSWVYQNWNDSIHSGDIANTPFGNPSKWIRVAEHILNERKSTLNSIGDGRYLDIRYEDWNGKSISQQIPVVRKIANELQYRFTYAELRAAAVEAARLEPPATGAVLMYNPVNKLHPGHTRIDSTNPAFKKALSNGLDAITSDPACRAFLQSKHYL